MTNTEIGKHKVSAPNGKEYVVEISYDEYPDDPREMGEKLSKMYIFHEDYALGDKKPEAPVELLQQILKYYGERITGKESVSELVNILQANENVVYKPIYIYEHSGITISNTSFNDRWDSWECGFIIVDRKTVKESKYGYYSDWREAAQQIIKDEMKEYDAYVRNEVYIINVLEEETIEHKCPHCGEVLSTSVDYEFVPEFSGIICYGEDELDMELAKYINID